MSQVDDPLLALWGEDSKKEQWPLEHFCLKKADPLMPEHFSSSLYASGAFQTAALALELRESKPEQVCAWAL